MVLKIGHRGAMGYEPENTLSSFEKAIELGVDMIELDVRLCKDLEVVVFHDDKLSRFANAEGYVIEKSLEELKKLDVKGGGKIPALREALNHINKRAKVNIELKGRGSVEFVEKIITE
ncbi:MAG: glycerophosphodiester phosphodiesterase, partial [Nanoarchaeota archaeon]